MRGIKQQSPDQNLVSSPAEMRPGGGSESAFSSQQMWSLSVGRPALSSLQMLLQRRGQNPTPSSVPRCSFRRHAHLLPGSLCVRLCRDHCWKLAQGTVQGTGPRGSWAQVSSRVFSRWLQGLLCSSWPIGKTLFRLRNSGSAPGGQGPQRPPPPSSLAFSGPYRFRHGFRRLSLPCPFPSLLGGSLFAPDTGPALSP